MEGENILLQCSSARLSLGYGPRLHQANEASISSAKKGRNQTSDLAGRSAINTATSSSINQAIKDNDLPGFHDKHAKVDPAQELRIRRLQHRYCRNEAITAVYRESSIGI